MNSKNQIFDLISLLKVFDANFVSEADIAVLSDLDANNPEDILKAVNALLIPEFQSFLPTAQARLKEILRSHLDNSAEDFGILFDRLELAFESPIVDRRAFMGGLLKGLEHSTNNR